uniref:Uncharacterized protein n=1 Tax=Timema tahoe TaxID=61484 RepID=A0A7R9IGJ7_9NEOP|nr:unnamed protein product [Timema tahoe]
MAGNKSCVKGGADISTLLIWLETETVSREIYMNCSCVSDINILTSTAKGGACSNSACTAYWSIVQAFGVISAALLGSCIVGNVILSFRYDFNSFRDEKRGGWVVRSGGFNPEPHYPPTFFSSLKLLKSYMRNSTNEDRLNGLHVWFAGNTGVRVQVGCIEGHLLIAAVLDSFVCYFARNIPLYIEDGVHEMADDSENEVVNPSETSKKLKNRRATPVVRRKKKENEPTQTLDDNDSSSSENNTESNRVLQDQNIKHTNFELGAIDQGKNMYRPILEGSDKRPTGVRKDSILRGGREGRFFLKKGCASLPQVQSLLSLTLSTLSLFLQSSIPTIETALSASIVVPVSLLLEGKALHQHTKTHHDINIMFRTIPRRLREINGFYILISKLICIVVELYRLEMSYETTICYFVTAPLMSHSQPAPNGQKELFLLDTVTLESSNCDCTHLFLRTSTVFYWSKLHHYNIAE